MLVLWIVVVLGTISAGVVRATRTSAGLATNARAGLVARAAAESGIEATVAAIEDTLTGLTDQGERRDWLNGLPARGVMEPVALGDGRFAVSIVDVSARLDVNAASESALRTFFSQFTDPVEAAAIARAIRARIDTGAATGITRHAATDPIRSLEALRSQALVPSDILERAAPYLTVDGDGTINARTAVDTVRIAAAGELRDEPARLLLISRGWLTGHALTREIQAVYAVSGNRLVFSHWREQGR